jgi:hypothetical protein
MLIINRSMIHTLAKLPRGKNKLPHSVPKGPLGLVQGKNVTPNQKEEAKSKEEDK